MRGLLLNLESLILNSISFILHPSAFILAFLPFTRAAVLCHSLRYQMVFSK